MNPFPDSPNGLVYYSEQDLINRQFLIDDISNRIKTTFKKANRAIDFIRIETPCLVPQTIIAEHLDAQFPLWSAVSTSDSEKLWLRPESTKGTYQMFDVLFPQDSEFKKNLPVCLWQSGLSFRVEQDKTFRHLRFKQFYQLEFQIAYSETTKADYHLIAADTMHKFLLDRFPSMFVAREYLKDDELPFYSKTTADLYLSQENERWEVIAISNRTDFKVPIIEISCGLDRLTYLLGSNR